MSHINLGKKKKRERTFNKQSHQNIYQNKRWKRVRDRKWKDNSVCEDCKREGRTTQAQEIHHIKPAIDYPELAFDYDNLMSLCIEHHKLRDRKH